MDHQHHPDQHLFMAGIIQSLHLRLDDFIYNVAHQARYETILYHWMLTLYKKGKSVDDAIQLIYRARHFWLLGQDKIKCRTSVTINKPDTQPENQK
ncbi:hypothetical protein [Aquimarina pacifica]|uniref:hypothetical protein n=1 Tax=Aquimarina pacifica TaxID=1296415 RepID=UPI00046FCC52|nr:hypothetical protein [Aquimarina pacifica]